MDKERPEDRGNHVYPDVGPDRIEASGHVPSIDPYRQDNQCQTCRQWEIHHLLRIELNMFLVPRTNTGDENQQQRYQFAVDEIPVLIDGKLSQTVVKVQHQVSHRSQCLVWHGIHEELYQQRDIYQCTEYLVHILQFFCFFHFAYYLCLVFLAVLALSIHPS